MELGWGLSKKLNQLVILKAKYTSINPVALVFAFFPCPCPLKLNLTGHGGVLLYMIVSCGRWEEKGGAS